VSKSEDLHDGMADLVARVEALERPRETKPTPQGEFVRPDDDAEPYFTTAEEWVRKWLSRTLGRRLGSTTRWCERWQEHPEACWRLEAMWRTWEASRCDKWLGASLWTTQHFDPSWAILTSAEGTFRGCDAERHAVPPDLPTPASGRNVVLVGKAS
jgi:hypothetical protein